MSATFLGLSIADVKTTSGFNYHTYYSRPVESDIPWILFTHGFPSTAYDWRHQISTFKSRGYGIIAPDLLGYGGSDAPTDVLSYRLKNVTDSVIEVIDRIAGNETRVLSVGHDWGSALLSRMANYHPKRFIGYAFLGGPYVPTGKLDLDAANAAAKQSMGYAPFEYFNFFNKSEAGSIVDAHKASFVSLIYPSNATSWIDSLCAPGGVLSWLKQDKKTPRPDWISEDEEGTHSRLFAQRGYGPALNYYKSALSTQNEADEAALGERDLKTNKQVLYIAAQKDPLTNITRARKTIKDFAYFNTVWEINAGHWLHLEQPEEVGQVLQKHFASAVAAAYKS